MSTVQNNALAELRRMQAAASSNPVEIQTAGSSNFADKLQSALEAVNETQQQSLNLAKAVEHGDNTTSLSQVMVAGQKAELSFQTVLQVRNKLIAAYQDIMNMPL